MNHKCHGDYVPALRVYRCLMDSSIVHNTDLPETCPVCEREASPIQHDAYKLFVTVSETFAVDGSEYVLSSKTHEICVPENSNGR